MTRAHDRWLARCKSRAQPLPRQRDGRDQCRAFAPKPDALPAHGRPLSPPQMIQSGRPLPRSIAPSGACSSRGERRPRSARVTATAYGSARHLRPGTDGFAPLLGFVGDELAVFGPSVRNDGTHTITQSSLTPAPHLAITLNEIIHKCLMVVEPPFASAVVPRRWARGLCVRTRR
jgi:hypothetical protein